MTVYYILSGNAFPLQDGEPVLITEYEFIDCCCGFPTTCVQPIDYEWYKLTFSGGAGDYKTADGATFPGFTGYINASDWPIVPANPMVTWHFDTYVFNCDVGASADSCLSAGGLNCAPVGPDGSGPWLYLTTDLGVKFGGRLTSSGPFVLSNLCDDGGYVTVEQVESASPNPPSYPTGRLECVNSCAPAYKPFVFHLDSKTYIDGSLYWDYVIDIEGLACKASLYSLLGEVIPTGYPTYGAPTEFGPWLAVGQVNRRARDWPSGPWVEIVEFVLVSIHHGGYCYWSCYDTVNMEAIDPPQLICAQDFWNGSTMQDLHMASWGLQVHNITYSTSYEAWYVNLTPMDGVGWSYPDGQLMEPAGRWSGPESDPLDVAALSCDETTGVPTPAGADPWGCWSGTPECSYEYEIDYGDTYSEHMTAKVSFHAQIGEGEGDCDTPSDTAGCFITPGTGTGSYVVPPWPPGPPIFPPEPPGLTGTGTGTGTGTAPVPPPTVPTACGICGDQLVIRWLVTINDDCETTTADGASIVGGPWPVCLNRRTTVEETGCDGCCVWEGYVSCKSDEGKCFRLALFEENVFGVYSFVLKVMDNFGNIYTVFSSDDSSGDPMCGGSHSMSEWLEGGTASIAPDIGAEFCDPNPDDYALDASIDINDSYAAYSQYAFYLGVTWHWDAEGTYPRPICKGCQPASIHLTPDGFAERLGSDPCDVPDGTELNGITFELSKAAQVDFTITGMHPVMGCMAGLHANWPKSAGNWYVYYEPGNYWAWTAYFFSDEGEGSNVQLYVSLWYGPNLTWWTELMRTVVPMSGSCMGFDVTRTGHDEITLLSKIKTWCFTESVWFPGYYYQQLPDAAKLQVTASEECWCD